MAKLCVPDHTGHKVYDFTPNSPAAKKAEKIFNKLMNKGYVGGKRMADGSLKKICKFDPTAEEIFVHLRLASLRPAGAIYEPDPVLQTRLKPNGSGEMHVLGRTVIMDVDATGCRPVIGQPIIGERTLAVYGCSFTYGLAIAANETFSSLLQGMFPTWRVENYGVPSYGTSQNLIQLERETRWAKPELVTFCWIESHLHRSAPDIGWIQMASSYMPRPASREAPEPRLPRAKLDQDGALQMGSVRFPRHDLIGIDLSDFAQDPYYVDLVSFALFKRANTIVTEYGGHFFITTLEGRFSGELARRLAENFIPVVNASISGNEYRCLPDDLHPNAFANRIYADRIRDYLLRYTSEQTGAG